MMLPFCSWMYVLWDGCKGLGDTGLIETLHSFRGYLAKLPVQKKQRSALVGDGACPGIDDGTQLLIL